jgi:hypothetical protein
MHGCVHWCRHLRYANPVAFERGRRPVARAAPRLITPGSALELLQAQHIPALAVARGGPESYLLQSPGAVLQALTPMVPPASAESSMQPAI